MAFVKIMVLKCCEKNEFIFNVQREKGKMEGRERERKRGMETERKKNQTEIAREK